jgi:hypothetical protein
VSIRLALVPAAVPIVAFVAGLSFANRIEPRVAGLPFLLFWILAWVVATPAFLGLAYLLDRRADRSVPQPGNEEPGR